jgi:segregation and condensation protein B
MQTLLERGLIEQVGRAEVAGRPMTFGTTQQFLAYFGLRSLEDLPAADELRKVVVQKPENLLTVDPGLATAPPEELASADSPEKVDPALAAQSDANPASPKSASSGLAQTQTETNS